jgi:REP element-mobilizing transposase RayT
MAQSLVRIPLHIVFSTKNRQHYLQEPHQRIRMHKYLYGICANLGSPAVRINGSSDHVHVLCWLHKGTTTSALVRNLKSSSSKWFSEKHPSIDSFKWQRGYGAFAVSFSSVPRIIHYIENQEEHHRKWSFQDEFRNLCAEAGLMIDERFVWN